MNLPNLKLYHFVAQLGYLCCWRDPRYIARGKELQTRIQDHQVQTLLESTAQHTKLFLKKGLNPVVISTLDTWFKITRQVELKKEQQQKKPFKMDSSGQLL